MPIKKIIKSAANTYSHLPPELKIPFSLILYLLFLGDIIADFLNTVFSFLRAITKKVTKRSFSIKNPPVFKSKKYKKRNNLRNHNYARFHTPLLSKVKYFLFGFVFSLMFICLPIVVTIFLQELPHPHELTSREIAQTTKIYDRNHTLLYEFYANQNRTIVSLNDIPKHLQHATLAIEDKNFYKHPGFDITSIIRAFKENIQKGKPIQGGSTITQQLIKSSLLTSEKKVSRKVKEIVLAFWAERIYTKEQLLEMYFNQVPYGGTAWGIEAAAEVYFGKNVKSLNLAESAFLAGLTQAPSQYSPFGQNPTLWKSRQKEVLKHMVSLGYISQKEADNASKQTLSFRKQDIPLRAPHFVMYIKDWLIKRHGIEAVEKGGLSVITTLDIKKQEFAEKVVAEEVLKNEYLNLHNGAALVTDPKNGDILAMVGSRDFNDETIGNYNITTALRQPGSTVKAITYSAALMHGYTAASLLDDTPTTFANPGGPAYTPVNYDGRYYGKVSFRFALSNSLNLPAVKLVQKVGVPTMVNLAKDMGVTHWKSPENYGLSVTLGAAEASMLDMATAFGTLSNKGNRVDLNPIVSITDYKGNVLEKKEDITETRALPAGVAYIISNILSDNQTRTAAFGPNSVLAIPGHTVSVKTGTSDNKRDNWTIGYTDKFVVTVWVGNNDNSPMSPVLASGITGAAPIWNRIMVQLLGSTPTKLAEQPADITMKICNGKPEYFLRGTENTAPCNTPRPVYSSISN